MVGCVVCVSLSQCGVCDVAHDYYLSGLTCVYCNSTHDIYFNSSSSLCEACGLVGCVDCASLSQCNTCDSAGNYNRVGSVCVYCNVSANVLFNATLGGCETCSLSNCVVCASLLACSVCDSAHSYFINGTTLHC